MFNQMPCSNSSLCSSCDPNIVYEKFSVQKNKKSKKELNRDCAEKYRARTKRDLELSKQIITSLNDLVDEILDHSNTILVSHSQVVGMITAQGAQISDELKPEFHSQKIIELRVKKKEVIDEFTKTILPTMKKRSDRLNQSNWTSQEASLFKSSSHMEYPTSDKYGPLPDNWKKGITDDGFFYFIDCKNHTTTWNDPRVPMQDFVEDQNAINDLCNSSALNFIEDNC